MKEKHTYQKKLKLKTRGLDRKWNENKGKWGARDEGKEEGTIATYNPNHKPVLIRGVNTVRFA